MAYFNFFKPSTEAVITNMDSLVETKLSAEQDNLQEKTMSALIEQFHALAKDWREKHQTETFSAAEEVFSQMKGRARISKEDRNEFFDLVRSFNPNGFDRIARGGGVSDEGLIEIYQLREQHLEQCPEYHLVASNDQSASDIIMNRL